MMDDKGSSTIEITVVLVIIILILGAILTSVENTTDKIIKSQETGNIETLINEVVDNLINNPGKPVKWYEYEKGTPGLAIINEDGQIIPNSVSYTKFNALGKNYKKLITENSFHSEIKSSMELIPQKSTISSVKIGHDDESSIIYSVNRLVKCDFFKKYVIKDFQNDGKCNHEHDQNTHSCNYFKIFKGNLKSSNYYLIVDESEKYHLKYSIGTTAEKNINWQTASSNVISINEKIIFHNDTGEIVFVHLDKPKAKAVIVSVPKNFDRNHLDYSYFITNECKLILKCWY
ncbi:hypothetical protein [Methanobrevibacter sp.]|uniref:hypothetical protein n=1 Tax=Methanobrevibacter sp. TaxID=66852 RepID=UPI0025DB8CA4|nr:hypothetical protein [Methanobrevibacter sp.]